MKHAKNERFSMRDLKHYPINQSELKLTLKK